MIVVEESGPEVQGPDWQGPDFPVLGQGQVQLEFSAKTKIWAQVHFFRP